MSQQYVKLEKEIASREELEKLTLGLLRRAVFDGEIVTGSVMLGQIAGLVNEEKSLAQIFADMMASSQQAFEKLQATLGQAHD